MSAREMPVLEVTPYELLKFEAYRWVGVKESRGNNDGELIRMFQSQIGRAEREPWCLSFVQYCVNQVVALSRQAGLEIKTTLPETEHVRSMWNWTLDEFKSDYPKGPISVVCWGKKGTSSGHTGLLVASNTGTQGDVYLKTIEGNTRNPGASDGFSEREGDGVYVRQRAWGGFGDFEQLGFIDPFCF